MTIRIPARPGTSISHWLAGAVVMCALVLVPGVRAQAAPGDPPAVGLAPGAAPAGSPVTAALSGFDACKPDEGAEAGQVRLLWDGVDEVGSALLDAGGAAIEFSVPGDAAVARHGVSAVCNSNPKLTAVQPIDVVAPTVRLTSVPDITTLPIAEASDRLRDFGLVLGDVTGSGDVVEKQDPAAGVRVRPGIPVDVDLGTTAPRRVPVPSLVGLTVDDGRAVLTEVGLVLGDVTGDGGAIRSQNPGPQSLVPVGSGVAVSVDAAVPAKKADRGLPVLPLVLAGIVAAAVLAGVYRVIRTRRARTWTHNHVRVAPDDMTGVGSAMEPAGQGPSGDVVVRIDHHIDAGEHRLEEISR